ncbi:DUF1289 domain-containing protein [Azospirillum sp. TSH100]|nr:DUF1289 domain-containing protein [Azospirillum sp. TSH100]QCG91125.1 DUF1289 domain-containing protein [Azospirillum sp. TSH100]
MSGKRNRTAADRNTSYRDTRDPCIGLCRFGGDGTCRGCHRTKAEVKGWKRLGDAAKAAINARIGAGIRQGVQAAPAEGKAPRKRLRKLDKKIGKLEAKLALLRAERGRVADSAGQTLESSR